MTGPTSSVTSSIARRVKARRAIAAAKLQAIEEEAALAEMERKLNLTTVEEELKIQKRKREVEMRATAAAAAAAAAAAIAAAEIEDEEKLKKLEAEQKRASFEAEKKRLEAQRALIEAEEEESMVSLSLSRTSRRSRTSITVKRPTASTPARTLHPTSFLQGVTPLRGIFSGESKRSNTTLSLPPSYATRDPIFGGSSISKSSTGRFELEYTEFTRESKTRSVNGGSEAGANNEESVAARAEAAAHAAEAALSAAHRERAAAEAAVAAVEIMQRTARDTAQKFADSATQAERPQLKMMEEQNQHLRTAVEGMNILSSQNALIVTKINPFTENPRDFR